MVNIARKYVLLLLYLLAIPVIARAIPLKPSKPPLHNHNRNNSARLLPRTNALLRDVTYYNKPSEDGTVSYQLLATRYKRWQNLARSDPQGFIQMVSKYSSVQLTPESIAYINNLQSMSELTLQDGLQQSALAMVLDEGPKGLFDHLNSQGQDPQARIASYGSYSWYGENLIAGHYNALDGIVVLINDVGVNDRGHRINIYSPKFDSVGIACGPHTTYGIMCAFEFAADFVPK
ncbi:hypothetical protein SmJEL517_g02423 [Synchytrium microbalum]|uniref:SCP domain-containing protein n=1 Tax=Synchytrium microbalum TaxID=1806994 RepID=A0A507C6Q5_9FUNG|nr:uncharacterized protein SmJEL517_g02423 [Synchytrium microbalum]TPX35028.1 hypothetical protein SmJEL517_g02423 [Synchytrium microbalum]